jgi:flagellar hook-associated protein 1
MGLFSGLHVGASSLTANQKAMEVIGHNLANVATEGYSRQRPVMATNDPTTEYTMNGGYQKGAGVNLQTIERMHDEFTEVQLRSETRDYGQYQTEYENYQIIERVYNEPAASGIATGLDNFFNSWSELAAPAPFDTTKRETLKYSAITLSDSINNKYNKLLELQKSIDKTIGTKVQEINADLSNIAGLNDIIALTPGQIEINDLFDKRDNFLLSLSEKMNFSIVEHSDRTIDLSIQGRPLVTQGNSYPLSIYINSSEIFGEVRDSQNQNIESLFDTGEIHGLIRMRDTIIKDQKDKLDTLSSTIITEVNQLHQRGYDLEGNTNSVFFEGTNASTITVSTAIKGNSNYIAAASSFYNKSGNGDIATQIGDLEGKKMFNNSSYAPDEYFLDNMSRLANDSAYAKNMAEGQQSLITSLQERKDSVSGVSIDEEMVDLMMYERSYAAAAKYLATIGKVLDTMLTMV